MTHEVGRDLGIRGPGPRLSASPRRGPGSWGACALVGALLVLAGCGDTNHAAVWTPRHVPSGAVAIVAATPVTVTSFEHWLPIIQRGRVTEGATKFARRQAIKETMSFLVKAQWLLQESRAEGINELVVNRLVAKQMLQAQPQAGMTSADVAFQARLNVIADALQIRHSKAAVTQTQVTGYYAAHRSQFVERAVRDTLMVVTDTRSAALTARAALARGEPWAAVAKRWSLDSSALNGGRYAVAKGVQSAMLVRAVFAARQGAVVGPVKAPSAAEPATYDYYLFKVTRGWPASSEPLAQVAAQIRRTLTEQEREQALAAFTRAYESRWRSRTLCGSGYLAPECHNHDATRGRAP
jgi:parvulin-like peptidyl-prolyl cis-trans isomerase-like protein